MLEFSHVPGPVAECLAQQADPVSLTEKVAQSSVHLVEWWPVDDPGPFFHAAGGGGGPHGSAHGQHGAIVQRYARRQNPGCPPPPLSTSID